jgi:hypothetical protein
MSFRGSRIRWEGNIETIQGNLRPNLVIVSNNKAIIINITITVPNTMEAMTETRQHKLRKYEDLERERERSLSNKFSEMKVNAIVLGSLGT